MLFKAASLGVAREEEQAVPAGPAPHPDPSSNEQPMVHTGLVAGMSAMLGGLGSSQPTTLPSNLLFRASASATFLPQHSSWSDTPADALSCPALEVSLQYMSDMHN